MLVCACTAVKMAYPGYGYGMPYVAPTTTTYTTYSAAPVYGAPVAYGGYAAPVAYGGYAVRVIPFSCFIAHCTLQPTYVPPTTVVVGQPAYYGHSYGYGGYGHRHHGWRGFKKFKFKW